MKHILLVDDVSTNLKCEEHILHDRYKVTMVKSGEDALRYLEEQTPDLILLDIYLRKMNGYEVMEHMQKSPHLSKIPEQEEEERSIASGAVDLIRKPFDPQMLLNRIEAVWKREA